MSFSVSVQKSSRARTYKSNLHIYFGSFFQHLKMRLLAFMRRPSLEFKTNRDFIAIFLWFPLFIQKEDYSRFISVLKYAWKNERPLLYFKVTFIDHLYCGNYYIFSLLYNLVYYD